jgi:hypothetical protein
MNSQPERGDNNPVVSGEIYLLQAVSSLKLGTWARAFQMDLLLVTHSRSSTFYIILNSPRQYRGRDPMVLKGLVLILMYVRLSTWSPYLRDPALRSILDTLHTILCFHSIYWWGWTHLHCLLCWSYQVSDPQFRQCNFPRHHRMVSFLIMLDGIASDSEHRSTNVSCRSTYILQFYDTSYFSNII